MNKLCVLIIGTAYAALSFQVKAEESGAMSSEAADCLRATQAEDYVSALEPCTVGAEQGVAESQYNLGHIYFHGRGVPPDEAEAAKWWRKAAEQEYAEAQYSLALTYAGDVPQGASEAVKWFRRAAEKGHEGAQFTLGGWHESGYGVPQDDAEAAKWWRKAAEHGHAGAQDRVGIMYREGRGVPQDYAEALKWFRMAAEQGDAIAQSNLGFMYANGKGVPKDRVIAHSFFNVAGANGYGKAREARDKMATLMTREQIAEAQKLAREWMEKHRKDE